MRYPCARAKCRAVCFVDALGRLNKAHVQFLEANLARQAQAAKRLPLDNGKAPAEPALSEAETAECDRSKG